MNKIMKWVEQKILPAINRFAANLWIDAVSKAVMAIVPFILVGSLITVWDIIRIYLTFLPDISIVNTYTFGLVSLFVVFLIPYNVMVNKKQRNNRYVAGFTGLGVFLLVCKGVSVEEGVVFNLSLFGSAGLFTAIVVGLLSGLILSIFGKHSFFKKDGAMPSFVANWFDSILPVFLCIILGWLIAYVGDVDVFSVVGKLFSPLTAIGNSFIGYVLLSAFPIIFYSMGISDWTFQFLQPLHLNGLEANAVQAAAGKTPTNIFSYGSDRPTSSGGTGCTWPLVIMMLFSKSKKYKSIGRFSLVPAIFNINEPLIFGAVAFNPLLMIPMWLIAIILPSINYIAYYFNLAALPTKVMGMWYAPTFINMWLTTPDVRNIILVLVNLVVATIIWYPFFKVAEKMEVEKEQKDMMIEKGE